MEWRRPVPVIGDATSARERAADPAGWAFPVAERDALHRIIGARRDVRRFRPDPVPAEVLDRVLSAAHAAPSVGHSQPWRFVVVTAAATRDRAALLADRERQEQAARLDPDSARRLLDLQLEGLREAPLGVVVCCDRRTPAAGVLGRNTFPDADLWSCACAIENLWLAARAEGLGLGWVTLFRPDDLAGLLGLPAGVATLGWLCLGWPDERPPAPGLERAGWSRRAPLADVVLVERWPAAEPEPPPSHLAQPAAPGQRAVVGVRDRADALLTPPGSLGVLDRALDRVLALGHADPGRGTLLLAGADHPVAALGVSAYRPEVTADVLAAAVAGQAVGTTAAASAGLVALVVDAGVGDAPVPGALPARPLGPRGDLAGTDALTAADVSRLLDRGRELAAGAAGRGLLALGEVGVGNTTVAAALAAAALGADPAEVTGLGAGADTAMLARKTEVVAAALARTGAGPDTAPERLLAALGGAEIAVLTGAVLGAAEHRVAVLLDGLATSVAALLAVRMLPAAGAHLVAGQRSRERAHPAVLRALGLEPLLDLRIRSGEGAGAVLATRLLGTALDVRRHTAATSEIR